MKTSKWCAVFFLTLLSFGFASAQVDADDHPKEKHSNREKIKTMKIAYFTEQLNLTSEEATVFWPVYNEYEQKKIKLREDNRNRHKAAKSKEKLSNKEMEEVVDGELNFKIQMLEIDKAFHSKIKTVLPIEKVMKMYKAEHGFKREVMKKMRKNTQGKQTNSDSK